MDRNFHIDDFERLLREKSNEFRMYPSKRIWHSIYNNIHPGRKWPSVAMCITLISALFLIGYLNTNNTNLYTGPDINSSQQNIFSKKNSPQIVTPIFVNNSLANKTSAVLPNIVTTSEKATASTKRFNIDINNRVVATLPGLDLPVITQLSDEDDDINSQKGIKNQLKKDITLAFITGPGEFEVLARGSKEILGDYNATEGKNQLPFLNPDENRASEKFPELIPIHDVALLEGDKKIAVEIPVENAVVENSPVLKNSPFISIQDQGWIENYALYNRPVSKKWANKLALQMYATPSLVYRTLFNAANTVNATPLAISSINGDINNSVNHSPSIGFEFGTGIQYKIFKGVKIKSGLQINYTRYNSHAFQNTHPVSTRVTMYDFKTNTSYEVNRSTPHSNRSGLEAEKLHNVTYQLSLPIGVDLKLLGNENLQWNVGATLQPTYVAGGKSYLISSDRRYYVKETSMINNWNLNAGFETFISFKTRGLTYQVGPQFRTQLFSTNNRKLAVGEKLVTYGLKFGVSKTIK